MLRHSNIYWVYKTANMVNDFKWWILHRVHPKYRYHVHKFHRLKPSWHDVDYKMLHACFDFLEEFVEGEGGLDSLKYQFSYIETNNQYDSVKDKDSLGEEYYNKGKEVYLEVKDLYDWWKNITNEEIDDIEFFAEDVPDKDICNKNLIRLIKVRRYLWT